MVYRSFLSKFFWISLFFAIFAPWLVSVILTQDNPAIKEKYENLLRKLNNRNYYQRMRVQKQIIDMGIQVLPYVLKSLQNGNLSAEVLTRLRWIASELRAKKVSTAVLGVIKSSKTIDELNKHLENELLNIVKEFLNEQAMVFWDRDNGFLLTLPDLNRDVRIVNCFADTYTPPGVRRLCAEEYAKELKIYTQINLVRNYVKSCENMELVGTQVGDKSGAKYFILDRFASQKIHAKREFFSPFSHPHLHISINVATYIQKETTKICNVKKVGDLYIDLNLGKLKPLDELKTKLEYFKKNLFSEIFDTANWRVYEVEFKNPFEDSIPPGASSQTIQKDSSNVTVTTTPSSTLIPVTTTSSTSINYSFRYRPYILTPVVSQVNKSLSKEIVTDFVNFLNSMMQQVSEDNVKNTDDFKKNLISSLSNLLKYKLKDDKLVIYLNNKVGIMFAFAPDIDRKITLGDKDNKDMHYFHGSDPFYDIVTKYTLDLKEKDAGEIRFITIGKKYCMRGYNAILNLLDSPLILSVSIGGNIKLEFIKMAKDTLTDRRFDNAKEQSQYLCATFIPSCTSILHLNITGNSEIKFIDKTSEEADESTGSVDEGKDDISQLSEDNVSMLTCEFFDGFYKEYDEFKLSYLKRFVNLDKKEGGRENSH